MHQVKIESSSGEALLSYTISTPKVNDAERIDPALPTIIFLHPVYVSQHIFHYQFASSELRRFNLIAVDMRSHGNTISSTPSTYRAAQAAEDVFCFMDALDLPPCHLFGVSFGACIALEMAVTRPERALSLFLLSPVPLTEPDFVAAGRQEIYDCWAAAYQNPNDQDEDAAVEAVQGAVQLGFGQSSSSSFCNSIVQHAMVCAPYLWAREQLDELHTVSVKFFIDRRSHSVASLKNITCPVYLVHCAEDVAYSLEMSEEICAYMKTAGIDARVSQIADAPQIGCATHPEPVNKLFYEWMLSIVGDATIPPAKATVTSPFEAVLKECGFSQGQSDSEDDDLLIAV